MYIVAGLGNPGDKYMHTRHNAGFDAVEILAQKLGVPVRKRAHHALVGEAQIAGEKVLLCKPQMYMNLSGEAVAELVNYYKIGLDRLIVVYDDVDLKLGEIRVRAEGGPGTHNGMRSVIACLGSQDFARVRVGIGPCPENMDIADFVLSQFDRSEWDTAFDALTRAAGAIAAIIAEGVPAAQSRFNGNAGGAAKAET